MSNATERNRKKLKRELLHAVKLNQNVELKQGGIKVKDPLLEKLQSTKVKSTTPIVNQNETQLAEAKLRNPDFESTSKAVDEEKSVQSMNQVWNLIRNHLVFSTGMNPQRVSERIENIRLAMQDEPDVIGVDSKTKGLTREGVVLPNTNFIQLVLFFLSDKKSQRKDPPGYSFFLSGLQELGIETGGPRLSKTSGQVLEDVQPDSMSTPKFFNRTEMDRFVTPPPSSTPRRQTTPPKTAQTPSRSARIASSFLDSIPQSRKTGPKGARTLTYDDDDEGEEDKRRRSTRTRKTPKYLEDFVLTY